MLQIECRGNLEISGISSAEITSGRQGEQPRGFFLVRSKLTKVGGDHRGPKFGEIRKIALPLFITSITFIAINQFDLWIVGAYLPEVDVGIYGATLRLILFISMPLVIINSVLPPIIGELYAKGEHTTLEQVLRVSATFASLPALLLSIAFLAAPSWILNLAFGPAYHTTEAIWALVILSIGKIASVYLGSCGNTLIMTGHQGVMMNIALVGGLITVIIGVALVQPMGIIGAALGSSLGLITQNLLMWNSVKRKTGIKTHSSFLLLPGIIRALITEMRVTRRQ